MPAWRQKHASGPTAPTVQVPAASQMAALERSPDIELQDMRRLTERSSATVRAELRAVVEETANLRRKVNVLAEAPPAMLEHMRSERRQD